MRRKKTEICQTFITVLKGGGGTPSLAKKQTVSVFFMKASVSEIRILNTSSSSY